MSQPREVIFEYTRIGNSIRVTAVDAETGTEVVFQAPTGTPTSDLQKMAVNKLKYVMGKQKS
jgi:predicted acylesterase/phospholipase RssA